jgi:hypothetical protein
MAKEISDRFKHVQIANPRQPLEGCPGDLREGIINYWRGNGISLRLLEKYYNFRGSLTIVPSKEQLRALYPH